MNDGVERFARFHREILRVDGTVESVNDQMHLNTAAVNSQEKRISQLEATIQTLLTKVGLSFLGPLSN